MMTKTIMKPTVTASNATMPKIMMWRMTVSLIIGCMLSVWTSLCIIHVAAAADDSTSSNIGNAVGNDGTLPPTTTTIAPSRLMFGSCHSQLFDSSQIWDTIYQRRPTAFVWGGDSVYGDDDPTKKRNGGTPDHMNELWNNLRNHPGYKKLIDGDRDGNPDGNDRCHIFGTLDDHDYGINNGDSTFPYKYDNAIEFVRFLGMFHEAEEEKEEDKGSSGYQPINLMAQRSLKGKGVYGVQVYDFSRKDREQRVLSDQEAGIDPDLASLDDNSTPSMSNKDSENRLVAVFVLDIRTNKSPWPSSSFQRDTEGDFLGDEQWVWLQQALERSNAAVNIIVSGLQVHAPFMHINQVENWAGFPSAQHRLYQTILKSNASAPIIISGDVHMSQLMKKDCRRRRQRPDPNEYERRPLYEITTSGMTMSWGSSDRSICGTPSKSKLCYFYPFNVWMGIVAHLAHHLIPLRSILQLPSKKTSKSKRARTSSSVASSSMQYTIQRNIAELDFDFDNQRSVSVKILSDTGKTLLHNKWSIDELNGMNRHQISSSSSSLSSDVADFELDETSFEWSKQIVLQQWNETSRISDHDDFVCVSYRGEPTNLHFLLALVTAVLILLIGLLYPVIFVVGLILGGIAWRKRRGKRVNNDAEANGTIQSNGHRRNRNGSTEIKSKDD